MPGNVKPKDVFWLVSSYLITSKNNLRQFFHQEQVPQISEIFVLYMIEEISKYRWFSFILLWQSTIKLSLLLLL